MDEERLGLDPTIRTSDGKHFIEIGQDSRPERLVIDERDDEGEILREVTQEGMINVARYYYHETIRIRDADDDIRNSVRTGLDITIAVAPTTTADAATTPESAATTVMANATATANAIATAIADSTAITIVMESASADDTAAPTTTIARRLSVSSVFTASTIAVAATTRRRRSTAQWGERRHGECSSSAKARDYRRPIYNASSPAALVAAAESCIQGHQSLRKAGFLHRNVSVNNVLINEREGTRKTS
ncbi:hypothetical protein V8C40DRAFT_281140 [Trichoderma camerunense]